MKITNLHGVSLPLAVWLLTDDYDYVSDPKYISATTLLKSTKQIVLGRRVVSADREMDVSDRIAAVMGHSMHDSIEKAWKFNSQKALKQLGYPDDVINRIVINPREGDFLLNKNLIPLYIEKRAYREIAGYKIGGKLDMLMDGRLFDFKTTSVWTYLKGRKDEDFAMQGSIYRWLNPEDVTEDHVHIQFIFTDWQRAMIKSNPEYPKIKLLDYPVEMHSIEDTEAFIVKKLNELSRLWSAPESQIPECTDKELWRSEPQYRYFADAEKAKDPTARSSKNFDTKHDADAHMASKGGKGVVIMKPGEVKACEYCPAFDICEQRKQYFAE